MPKGEPHGVSIDKIESDRLNVSVNDTHRFSLLKIVSYIFKTVGRV